MRNYFETSAVNYLLETMEIQDAHATRAFQNARGRKWHISPTVLVEVLLTNNPDRKEEIIYFSQVLFDRELLPPPEEIIINFIKNGCPILETSFSYESNHSFSSIWRDLYDFPDKTFIIDLDDFRRRYHFVRNYYKVAHVIGTQKFYSEPYCFEASIELLSFNLVKKVMNEQEIQSADSNQLLSWKIGAFLTISILCAEITLFPEVIKKFWAKLGVNLLPSRIEFIAKNFPQLIYRGPFAEMTQMILCQAQYKYSRGLIFDAFHCVYLPFVDTLISNDIHFKNLKSYFPHPIIARICHIDEAVWTKKAVELMPNKKNKVYVPT